MPAANVLTIPPGVPFLPCFVAALLDGRVVQGFSKALGPLALAQATIYVPTRRAGGALAAEFLRTSPQTRLLLPRILPLGALEENEPALSFEAEASDGWAGEALPEAVDEITRRLELADLILAWAQAIRHAIVSVDPQGRRYYDERESFLVATTPADAWHLSVDLADLIDELIIEGVAWKRLDPLVLPEFDSYWRITLEFLGVAMRQWPQILADRRRVDRARRQEALIDTHIVRVRQGATRGPVIAIGSTGSHRATARLLASIAAAPQGAVVLPGLDQSLDPAAWAMIAGGAAQEESHASFTHPQAALRRLLGVLKITREDVVSLAEPSPSLWRRNRFVSEALRPAESTGEWLAFKKNTDASALADALAGVSLIEAQDEREEALALAIAMREALATAGLTAALITPDRNLARRVRAELHRWAIEAEDSAGERLAKSGIGVLAHLAILCVARNMASPDVSALLAHPLARLGLARENVERRAVNLEIAILRSPLTAQGLTQYFSGSLEKLIAAAKKEAESVYAHFAKARISEEDWLDIGDLLVRLKSGFTPLFEQGDAAPLSSWVAAHRQVIHSIASPAEEDAHEAWGALDALFDKLEGHTQSRMVFHAQSYGLFFASVAGEIVLNGARSSHPRCQILGLLEARLLDADVVLLGGLDETVWPPAARSDVFLNRPMREALGLMPPERKIGQTAHDFTQLMGKAKVILSRARKRDGAPTVASRFLQRMAALAGPAWEACQTRGMAYLQFARQIDGHGTKPRPLDRPQPQPKVELRPTTLSVTQIETLRRDPYALYAEKILGLKVLEPLGGEAGFAAFGNSVHASLESFVRSYPNGALPEAARERLCDLLRHNFSAQLADPDFFALHWPRLEKIVDFYLAFEAERRTGIDEISVESKGTIAIPLMDGSMFWLTARADRLELNKDKSLTIVDYKTGTPPGLDEIYVGFAPQLTLQAAIALHGGFDVAGEFESVSGLYVKLGGSSGGFARPVDFSKKDMDFQHRSESHYQDLIDLLNQFRDPQTPYPPRPFPKFAKRTSAYDHLARVKEWSRGGNEENGT